jgi:hypothetical protein
MGTQINCSLVRLARINSCHANMAVTITLTLGQQLSRILTGLVGIHYFLTSQALDRDILAPMEVH